MSVTTNFLFIPGIIGLLTGCQNSTANPDPVAPALVETIRQFDARQGQHPENIAFDRQGTLYVTLHKSATVWKRDASGQEWLTQPVPRRGRMVWSSTVLRTR